MRDCIFMQPYHKCCKVLHSDLSDSGSQKEVGMTGVSQVVCLCKRPLFDLEVLAAAQQQAQELTGTLILTLRRRAEGLRTSLSR
jgi:hypothetical protein